MGCPFPKKNFPFPWEDLQTSSNTLYKPHQLRSVAMATIFVFLHKSSAVAEMRDRGHNRHGPKTAGLLCPFCGGAGSPSNIMRPGPRSTSVVRTIWRLCPSSHLATIDMGQKLGRGAVPLLGGSCDPTLHTDHLAGRHSIRTKRLVAWSSGRALVFGRCAFAVLRSTCS